MTENEPPKPTTLRFSPDVRRRLDEFATNSRRTLTAAVELLVTEALDARETLNADPTTDVNWNKR